MLAGPPSAAVLGDFLEARRVLEIEAAGLAAERATNEDVEALSGIFAHMEATADRAVKNAELETEYDEADIAFHHVCCGNRHAMLSPW